MSGIRPLEPGDLPAVAALYERVMRSGSSPPANGLEAHFRATLEHPWADPEIPSLVYEHSAGDVVGFLGSHVRRLRAGADRIRLGCSGQLVAEPGRAGRGVGALLLRRYLAGPQEATITDGATDEVRAMWWALSGRTNALASLAWTRPLRPASYVASLAARRRGWPASRLARATALADRVARRPLRPAAPGSTTEELTASALIEALDGLKRVYPLRPDYDEPFLDWLFGQLASVRERGRLVKRLVVGDDGRRIGWYVGHVPDGATAQMLQIGAAPADAGAVIERLVADAAGLGASAVSGRVEPHLLPHLHSHRFLLHRGEWALVHDPGQRLAATAAWGDGLLTRLDGEWWMGHHLEEVPVPA